MLAEKRRLEIVKFVNKKGSGTVHELSQEFTVTLMTINRDLRKLEKEGKLIVVRGGAITESSRITEKRLSERINFHLEAKQIISDKVLPFIKSGDSILLDASSTSIVLARKIKNLDIDDLTILTNSTEILNELMPQKKFTIISTGGTLLRKFNCLVGPLSELVVSQLRVNKFFFSVGGVSVKGELTDTNIQEVNLKKKMIEISKEKILMVESYKFNKIGTYRIIDLKEVDMVISDDLKIGEPFTKDIRSMGLKLI